MSGLLLLLLASAVAGVAVYFLLATGLRVARARGTRLVTCPESGRPTAVALAALATFPPLELRSCSRWPERAGCGRECLAEIEKAPDGCLVRAMAERFYEGRACVLCGLPFADLAGLRHALLSEDGATRRWDEVNVEELPLLFSSHRPVCWSCHVIRSVALTHPELVVVRPKRW